jgi:hypothetical protein
MRRGRGESAHTLVLTIKTQVLANFYFKKCDPTFDFEIFPHLFPKGMSV